MRLRYSRTGARRAAREPGEVVSASCENRQFGRPQPASAAKKVSSSAECQWTHASSVIDLRELIIGTASGPAGWRNCQVPLSTTSRIFSATIEVGRDSLSDLAKKPAIRSLCRYFDVPALVRR